MKLSITTLLMFVFLFCPLVSGQNKSNQGDPFKHPYANPVDNPELPRVLLIGDSISIGYTARVRKLLADKANVHRPKTNCRWSAFGDENVEEWVGDGKWDVIHFNFGLWDWYGWKQETKATPESYAANLNSIVNKLKKSKAKLIFGMTTPPCIGKERSANIVVSETQAKQFNDEARKVMKAQGVQVNDLYAAIGDARPQYQLAEIDVHYNDAGKDLLAAHVAEKISNALAGKKKQKRSPALKTTSQDGLPNALILGDSISIAYTPIVVKKLKGKVNVTRPRANCGDTNRYRNALSKWLGDKKWDVIHFNVGLHDLCYRHPDSKVQGNRDKVNGSIAVPIDEYEQNLEKIVTMLKATGAKLIWASTTIVPEGEAGRIVGDEVKYNQVAEKIMKKHGIQINDLRELSGTFPSSYFRGPGDVHFTAEGSGKLADQVAASIERLANAGK
jgi:lysophospholipase L1-like esterase